jgi:hypothetical protein
VSRTVAAATRARAYTREGDDNTMGHGCCEQAPPARRRWPGRKRGERCYIVLRPEFGGGRAVEDKQAGRSVSMAEEEVVAPAHLPEGTGCAALHRGGGVGLSRGVR